MCGGWILRCFRDERGELLLHPVCYRDRRTEGMMEAVFSRLSKGVDLFDHGHTDDGL